MKMYTHVQESLDSVYKELTRSDRYPLGGSASIVLANRDDPFTAGMSASSVSKLFSRTCACLHAGFVDCLEVVTRVL